MLTNSHFSGVHGVRIPLYVITWTRHRKTGAGVSNVRRRPDGARKTGTKSRFMTKHVGRPTLTRCAAGIERPKNDVTMQTRRKPAPALVCLPRKTRGQPRSGLLNGERLIQLAPRNWPRPQYSDARNGGKSFWRRNESDITEIPRRNCDSRNLIALTHLSDPGSMHGIANIGNGFQNSEQYTAHPGRRRS